MSIVWQGPGSFALYDEAVTTGDTHWSKCSHDKGLIHDPEQDWWSCTDCGDIMFDARDVEIATRYAHVVLPHLASGKGDTPRPVDKEEFDKNYEAVFGPTRKHVCRQWVKMPDGSTRCYYCNEPRGS